MIRTFVTPYAACGLDEYFAECACAYADVLKEVGSLWPRATREQLYACDPAMYTIVADIFGDQPETPALLASRSEGAPDKGHRPHGLTKK